MIISDYYDLFKCYSGTFKKSPYQKKKESLSYRDT